MIRKALFVFWFFLFLWGCLAVGRDFPTFDVKGKVQPNVTTRSHLFADFGEPQERGLESGYETWTYYYYVYTLSGVQGQKRLHVVFNHDGTVRSYSYSGS